jgi:hypothetical protein
METMGESVDSRGCCTSVHTCDAYEHGAVRSADVAMTELAESVVAPAVNTTIRGSAAGKLSSGC